MRETDRKGEMALAYVRLRALEKGIYISVPECPLRYDLILDVDGHLLKAQIKYADGSPTRTQGAVIVRTSTNYHSGTGYKERPYQIGEVDIILVYVPKMQQVVYLKPEQFVGKTRVQIRFEKAKINQKSIINANDQIW